METEREEETIDATTDTPPETEATTNDKPDHVKRFLAQLIDGVLAGFVFWALIFATVFSTIGYILAILVAGSYFLVRDGLDVDFMKGRSLGKKVMKLRPVRLDGAPMNLETSIKRNWMFGAIYLGSLPLLGVLGTIINVGLLVVILYECYKVLTDTQARRWGDELAGTRVIESAE